MLKGFKDFISRGNVIDLAVGVVIGAAFGALVKTFVDNLLNPILAVLPGAKSEGLGFFLDESKKASFINLSAMINAVIVFLLTAALLYFLVVMPMNKLAERRKAKLGIVEEDETPEDIALLREIRDSLAAGRGYGQVPPVEPRI